MNVDQFELISRATVQEAIDGLSKWIREQSDALIVGAAWIARFDELGITVEGLPSQLLSLLRKIHRGLIDASVVTTFSHNLTAIDVISQLKIEDQKRMASGEMLEVAEFTLDGGTTVRKMNPLSMPPEKLKRVIQGGVILTPSQQILTPPKQYKPKKVEAIRVDKKKQQLIVHGKVVQLSDVRLNLAGASDTPTEVVDPSDTKTVTLAREVVEKIDTLRKQVSQTREQYILRLIRIAGY